MKKRNLLIAFTLICITFTSLNAQIRLSSANLGPNPGIPLDPPILDPCMGLIPSNAYIVSQANFWMSNGQQDYFWINNNGSLILENLAGSHGFNSTVFVESGCTLNMTSFAMFTFHFNVFLKPSATLILPFGSAANVTVYASTGSTILQNPNNTTPSYPVVITCPDNVNYDYSNFPCGAPGYTPTNAPAVSASASSTVLCNLFYGVTLTGVSTTANYTPNAFDWYKVGTTTPIQSGASATYNALAAGSYYFKARYVSGTSTCYSAFSNTITVTNPTPFSVSVSGPTLTCPSQPITLTASGATSYNWSGYSTGASLTVNPAVTSTYSVTGTNFEGCLYTQATTVFVNSICPNSSLPCGNTYNMAASIFASAVSGATSYKFNFYDNANPNLLKATYVSTNQIVILSNVPGLFQNTTYRWTVSAGINGNYGPESGKKCTVSISAPVATLPCTSVVSDLNTVISFPMSAGAAGYRITFKDIANPLASPIIYTIPNGTNTGYYQLNLSGIAGLNYNKSYNWTIEVKYAQAGGTFVYGPASIANCPLVIQPAKNNSVHCGFSIAFVNTGTVVASVPTFGATNYRIRFYSAINNSLVATKIIPTISIGSFNLIPGLQNNTTYKWTVEVEYSTGTGFAYGPESAACNITFGTPAMRLISSEQNSVMEELKINAYPNPTKDFISVDLNANLKNIIIQNLSGQIMLETTNNTQIDLSSFDNGIYILTVVTDSETKRMKITKE